MDVFALSKEFEKDNIDWDKIHAIFQGATTSELSEMLCAVSNQLELVLYMHANPLMEWLFERAYHQRAFVAGDAYFLENWNFEAVRVFSVASRAEPDNFSENKIAKAVTMTSKLLLSTGIEKLYSRQPENPEKAIEHLRARRALEEVLQLANERLDTLPDVYRAVVKEVLNCAPAIEDAQAYELLPSLVIDDESAEKILFLFLAFESSENEFGYIEKFIFSLLKRAPNVFLRHSESLIKYFDHQLLAEALMAVPVDENHAVVNRLLSDQGLIDGLLMISSFVIESKLHKSNAWFLERLRQRKLDYERAKNVKLS